MSTERDDLTTIYDLAQHLRSMREAAGMTIAESASASGLPAETLWGFERSERLRRAVCVLNLFEIYGCSVIIRRRKCK